MQVRLSTSDKIDKVVTNRWLGLPIFAVIMFLVYYISMVTVGSAATDWANDGVFGDGWHLLGIGSSEFADAEEKYGDTDLIIDAFANEYGSDEITAALDAESDSYTEEGAKAALDALVAATPADANVSYDVEDEETLAVETVDNVKRLTWKMRWHSMRTPSTRKPMALPTPPPMAFGCPASPSSSATAWTLTNAAPWLNGLILDGIVAGVGAVLGFVPQMLVLFLLLAFLEACGYMARIAFVLDRVFRKFGLSGKSFIPMLIGTGCGVPGIMASRTIENERDRRMTIMTTTFIPCGAKMPFIAMIAGAIFGGSAWVSTSAYFMGMACIIVSGIILKKTKMFSGDPAPFVMELPAYHLAHRGQRSALHVGARLVLHQEGRHHHPAVHHLRLVHHLLRFRRRCIPDALQKTRSTTPSWPPSAAPSLGSSLLWAGATGRPPWLPSPVLWPRRTSLAPWASCSAAATAMCITTLAATFTAVTGYSFLVFNLLCAPCFAAMGAIKREMNNAKWTWFAIGYQCGFAYVIALIINQIGCAFTGNLHIVGLIVAIFFVAAIIYLLVRPYKEADTLKTPTAVGAR